MIIALGESIVAIGVGAAGVQLDAGTITAALLGVVVAAALWWSYFDWVVYISQARLAETTGEERALLARDLYTYLHLPMVAGIILFALGMKTTLAHVDDPLDIIAAIGLCGGLALYMAAHVAMRLRIGGGWGHGRPTATVVLLVLLPVATMVPALAALALVAAVCVALIAYEAHPLSVRALVDPQPSRCLHDGGSLEDRRPGRPPPGRSRLGPPQAKERPHTRRPEDRPLGGTEGRSRPPRNRSRPVPSSGDPRRAIGSCSHRRRERFGPIASGRPTAGRS